MEFDELSRNVIGCATGRLWLSNRLARRWRCHVEIKSVETLPPIHQAQILTYMRLAKVPLGFLINFNVTKLRNGTKRFVL